MGSLAVSLLVLASCTSNNPQLSGRQRPPVQVDHVIVGVADLDAGIRAFEQLTGVRPAVGGAHPGKGTRNALLSLGEGVYLELFAPNPAEKIDSPTLAELRGLKRLKPIGWAVSTPDADALRSYLGSLGLEPSAAEPGSRVRPDGSVLQWVTFGFETIDHPLAPFFIQWKQQRLHPSRTSPGGCRLTSIRLLDPAPKRLGSAVRPLGLDVPVDRGAESRMEVRLSCPRGSVVLD